MHQGLAVSDSSSAQSSNSNAFKNGENDIVPSPPPKFNADERPAFAFMVERRKRQDQSVELQERERHRIAMELHDGLGQTLTLMKLDLMHATALLPDELKGDESAMQSLHRLKSRLHYAFDELRRTVMDLRPTMIDDLGILPTLSWLFREFEVTAKGIVLEKKIAVSENQVPANLKMTIFRILQESFNNAVKHAAADRIQVCLKHDHNKLDLSVQDNGRGFDPHLKAVFHRNSGGVAGIMERARLSGGTCLIESDSGQGTRIQVCWEC